MRPYLVAFLFVAFLAGSRAENYDVLIRGGRLLDGTGMPWRYADLAIKADRIVEVGAIPATATAKEVVDARGLFVAPGFIDGHSHAIPALEKQALAGLAPLLAQGVTTVFINPDGRGPADLGPQLVAIRQAGPGVNVAPMIGHNAVRTAVLGLENRAPNQAELERMRALVKAAMQDGAFAFSSGPFYTPGNFSKTDELVALARVAAEWGGFYTSHIRDEGDYGIGLVAAVDEVITVAREAKLPSVVTHIKALGPHVWGLSAEVIKHIDAARAAGVEVWADQYPYEASSTGLGAALLQPWAQEGGAGALRARLANPEQRAKIRAEMAANLERRAGPGAIMFCRFPPDPSIEGQRLNTLALERRVEPVDLAISLLQQGSPSIISFNMQDDDITAFMRQPWTMTCSDGDVVEFGEGSPHPRSYGTYPRKLRIFALDRGVMSLERAIQSMTGMPAAVFHVRDRGELRVGAFADIAIFDPAKLRETSTYQQPHALAEGMVRVYVNGRAALIDGKATALRAGRVLSRRD
jgi:N-acyl-D-amino-acid deacylase